MLINIYPITHQQQNLPRTLEVRLRLWLLINLPTNPNRNYSIPTHWSLALA